MNLQTIQDYVKSQYKQLAYSAGAAAITFVLGLYSAPDTNHAEECAPELQQITVLREKLERQEAQIQTLVLETVQRTQESERELCNTQKAALSNGLQELNCEICNREIR
mgnify:CR=1 FL=1|tara:strand:- start:584 stop:910 length:327 start_codon:yes stop_codon:yes gene_type:complete